MAVGSDDSVEMRPFSKGVAFGLGISILKLAMVYSFLPNTNTSNQMAHVEHAFFCTATSDIPLLIVMLVFLGRAKYWRMLKISAGMMITMVIILFPAYMAAFSLLRE